MSQEITERQQMLATFKEIALINLNTENASSRVVGTFSKEDIKKYLKDKSNSENQKKLREISKQLYYTSSQYRRLINYYATLYNLDYVIEGFGSNPEKIDPAKYKNLYIKNVDYVERMNIKNEFTKARLITYRDGVFFGYARVSKDGFYIQELNPDYCRLSFIDATTGLLGYSFDFSTINSTNKIESYPDEFQRIYNDLQNKKGNKDKIVRIESPFAICLKANSDIYSIPPFVSLFEGLLDIADFKALNKNNEEIGNYKLLFQKIPMRTDKDAQINSFLIDKDFAQVFHDNIEENLPPQVGLMTSPMDIQAINFDRDSIDKNKVGQATSQYWNEAGVSELLFSSNSNSSAALKSSIIADESDSSILIKDIERWINEHLKATQTGAYKFRVRILETTRHNKDAYLDSRLKAAQFGMPVKNEIIAVMGSQPSSMYLNTYLENEVLELPLKLVPLQSSHTTSGDPNKKNGAPTKNETDLTDKGLQTKDLESNSAG
ncbi:hypothetical protein GRF59_15170 [Paenibacillus sp. HJL G12]|uniref:Phage portal protein n=1 Tax=Paenibacillus dendrobii TaxID=2691084 RepID=A0A7X3LHB0_9BACL|nr:hypothetical protein [Paenibacillus dendrobii]MWV44962.1 hypothetical protein [Paenibacillus dendrobii]